MAKKTVVYRVNENRGCMYYCLYGFAILFVIGLLVAILGYIAAAAVGISLWFLTRFIWRRMVVEMPENGFVRWGLSLAPIMRKVLAGVACTLLSIILMVAWGSNSRSDSIDSANPEGTQSETSKASPGMSAAEKENAETTKILTFSGITVEVKDNESSYTVKTSIAGTVKNDGNTALSSWQMPDLMRGNWSETLSMEDRSLDPGESTTFTYEGNAEWDGDYTWSFKEDDEIACVGLNGIAESLTQKFNENKEATAAAREEAARNSAEEAEQRHLESTCWVTPSGHSYHESDGCPKLNGSTNLTAMTVEEARNAGYDPCDYCAS